MTFTKFKTHNADGTQKTCKFCGEHVWWDWVYSKWYNTDGVTPHAIRAKSGRSTATKRLWTRRK